MNLFSLDSDLLDLFLLLQYACGHKSVERISDCTAPLSPLSQSKHLFDLFCTQPTDSVEILSSFVSEDSTLWASVKGTGEEDKRGKWINLKQ